MKKLLLTLLVVCIVSAISLTIVHLTGGLPPDGRPGCLKLFGILACIIIAVVCMVLLGSLLLNKRHVYYGGLVVGFGVSTWFSSRNMLGLASCPEVFHLKSCYVVFVSMIAFTILGVMYFREKMKEEAGEQ
ncbi:hypothetical protein SG34_005110 [Thalassomonas viridans]|uniref:Uncharacterized protein n=1 Tax=Thalassomonas viridans TaxID=137584 RepID=A0AAE9Z3Y4_9GAMM|nr:hypothetical protein [Thalassomonas viridans]WDE06306.1 hypothetical protein SG34_005110 [Thalassomonas viridans]